MPEVKFQIKWKDGKYFMNFPDVILQKNPYYYIKFEKIESNIEDVANDELRDEILSFFYENKNILSKIKHGDIINLTVNEHKNKIITA